MNKLERLQQDYENNQITTEDVLETITHWGWAPSLVFDDDGRWALSFVGTQPVIMGDEPIEMHMTVFVEKDYWCDSIREAVIYSLSQQSL